MAENDVEGDGFLARYEDCRIICRLSHQLLEMSSWMG